MPRNDVFINVYCDGSHNDKACISLSLTPFGKSPYVCMHDMCECMYYVHVCTYGYKCESVHIMSVSVCTYIIRYYVEYHSL